MAAAVGGIFVIISWMIGLPARAHDGLTSLMIVAGEIAVLAIIIGALRVFVSAPSRSSRRGPT